MAHSNKPGPAPRRDVMVRHLIWTWIQTLSSVLLAGALTGGALIYFGWHWSFGVILLTVLMAVPILSWYHSAPIVKSLTGCRLPNALDPNHRRLVKIVNRLVIKTGTKVKPPVYISSLKLPNAFATGRNQKNAIIAVTEGLLRIGLTDDELEAVLAHEWAHAYWNDVGINSMLSVMCSIFCIILAAGVPRMFHPDHIPSGVPLLDKLSDRARHGTKKFILPVGGVMGFLVLMFIYYTVGSMTKYLSLFVARVRESAADAQAAYWTGKPCALSTALQKISRYMKLHAADLREGVVTRGLSPILFVNALELDDPDAEKERPGIKAALRRWWKGLGENHPPIGKRIRDLDSMNGAACPRIK